MRIILIKKRNLYIFLFIILVSVTLLLSFKNKTSPVSNILITNKIIGIDPGHGGVDPGAVGISGVKEDEINLKIGIKLKKLIESNGGRVIMTRESKDGLYTKKSKTLKEMKTEDLHNRKKIIDNGRCDIFVTIHLNSFQQSKYHGAQTFYRKDDKESKLFATYIQDELRDVLDKNNHRLSQGRDDVFLINELDIPAVLIECGFLSNPREEKLLNTEEYQEKIAWAIYIGIMKYFGQMNGEYNF
ncbi:N-acetylmuramoyl-L-alanine amidase CwlD [Schnuerera sp.]|uniref:N-acetylmuramoyl-L-alanine amidase CwlD n=1 Tax=Schnuerera sp. TaxID=2794844 RepID=UPI002C32AE87|nr:N-acetylmuramoyl-L-alanine amidase CwlD [Schnuerera sp.]HSH36374.1 N-acetylmuramoyl-L-alanine amidase CwlD [Schnuerera sp.]